MKAIHVVPAISQEASGPSYSVVRLCEALSSSGVETRLAALELTAMSSPPPFLKLFPLGIGPRRLGRSPAMASWLDQAVRGRMVDLIHNHGMWQMNSVYPGLVTKKYGMTYLVSPRGALSAWSMMHGSLLKPFFWNLLQRPSFSSVSCFHATADMEYEDIRRLGFRQPVAVIPNGTDVPPLEKSARGSVRTLLFLGRLHRKKGLDLLLRAWAAVENRFPDWQLRIVGSDTSYYGQSGYLSELHRTALTLGLHRVNFSGELRGESKLQAYREAELFILPTYSENFGMTVAESLSSGTPTIVTKGAPWGGLEDNRAGWWIDIGIDPLVATLETAMQCPANELAEMGRRGRDWMERDFSWSGIGKRMHATYEWLRRGGTCPPWVRPD